jgi:uncharacterized protein (DUF305 family)
MSKPMTGEMGQAMTRGMKEMESMPMSGDTDHDFAMMMRTHHQSAVDMAEIELRTGKDPTLRSMAKNIISSQKKEIKPTRIHEQRGQSKQNPIERRQIRRSLP